MTFIFNKNQPLEIQILSGDYIYQRIFCQGCCVDDDGLMTFFPDYYKKISIELSKICKKKYGVYICSDNTFLKEVELNIKNYYYDQLLINSLAKNELYQIYKKGK